MYEGLMDKAKGDRIKGGRWRWLGWGMVGGGKWGQLCLSNNKIIKKKEKASDFLKLIYLSKVL